ncbi:MAG: hypothetical protein WDN04_02245 [Rhodospirillales bacterium]
MKAGWDRRRQFADYIEATGYEGLVECLDRADRNRAFQLFRQDFGRAVVGACPAQRVNPAKVHVEPVFCLLHGMTPNSDENIVDGGRRGSFGTSQRKFKILTIASSVAQIDAADILVVIRPDQGS